MASEFTTDQMFESRDDMLDWVRMTGRKNGVVIVIDKSAKKIDHNHAPAQYLKGHEYTSRLTRDEKCIVSKMADITAPRFILSALNERDPSNTTGIESIYNAVQNERNAKKGLLSNVQYALSQLILKGYFHMCRVHPETQAITDIVWIHRDSIELYAQFPTVLVIDVTYKTNEYRVPFLEVVGITSTNLTYSLMFGYMCDELTELMLCLAKMPSVSFCYISIFTETDVAKNKHEEFLQTLPRLRNWDGRMLCQYQGCWFPVGDFQGILSCQNNFKAHETDIILATMPKSGTTWLKALTFSIVNRHKSSLDESPLLISSPHDVVPFLELDAYRANENPGLESIPPPRIFATHVPYLVLPDSVPASGCKIIYICRNPLDQFISHRFFLLKNRFKPEEEPLSLEEAFAMYCDGIHPFGPFWNHMLEYYTAGLKEPEKVLFLKYEELREDVVSILKKMAAFVGMPFSDEEEKKGVVEGIAGLCSMKNLKGLNVNKEGNWNGIVANSSFYRKGEVGDWRNHLSGSMAKRVEKILEEKLIGSGLTFESYIKS
ncbi:hypothetical protein OROMI_019884 [Orobanche minor]